MPLAARLFIVLLFILAVIGLWRLPRSDGPARPPIKFAVSAQLERSMRGAVPGLGDGRFGTNSPILGRKRQDKPDPPML